MTKRKILFDVFFLFCAALAVFFLVLFILALIPSGDAHGIRITEPFDVSASLIDKSSGRYENQLRGTVFNDRESETAIDRMEIAVGNGDTSENVTVEGFVIYGRSERQILLKWQSKTPYDRVSSVTAFFGGDGEALANHDEGETSRLGIAFSLIGAALMALMAVVFGKQRYYLWQEEQMAKADGQNG